MGVEIFRCTVSLSLLNRNGLALSGRSGLPLPFMPVTTFANQPVERAGKEFPGRRFLFPLLLSGLGLLAVLPFPLRAEPVAVTPAFYPKNLGSPLLGAKLRVDATTGFHLANGYPVPTTSGGVQDASALLSDDVAGLEFAPGTHSLTIILAAPQVVSRVVFLNRSAEGTFTASISGTDPQLVGPPANPSETPLAGPDMANSAVFQPQTAQFIQLVFKISKRGNLGRLAVFGQSSDLDYSLRPPAAAPAPSAVPANTGAAAPPGFPASPVAVSGAAEVPMAIDVAALSSGARVAHVSSGTAGADPAWLIADSLDSLFFFNPADPAPTFDIDLHGVRRADRASLFLSGVPSRIDVIRIPAPVTHALPEKVEGVVSRAAGTVEIVGLEIGYTQNVHPGTLLESGQILRTSFDSSAEFVVNGTSLVRLGANSNALIVLGADGIEVHVLRGSVLWQVFDPRGGGVFVTPATITELPIGTLTAEVKLAGDTELRLLETALPGQVQVRSRDTGERFSPAAGQDISLGGGKGGRMAIAPFVVRTYWSLDPLGTAAGGLRNDVDKSFDMPPPPPPEDILGTVNSDAGLNQISIPFKEQTLDAIRFRITPLPLPSEAPQSPPVVVKAELFGTYKREELEVAAREELLPPTEPLPAMPVTTPPSAPTPAATQAPMPAPAPVYAPPPAPVRATPAPVMTNAPQAVAVPPPPQRVLLKEETAASPAPSPAQVIRLAVAVTTPAQTPPPPTHAPVVNAPAPASGNGGAPAQPQTAKAYKAEAMGAMSANETSVPQKKTIFNSQNSKTADNQFPVSVPPTTPPAAVAVPASSGASTPP